MSEDLLIRHCSPTLAGIKPGNMFPCAYGSNKELQKYIRHLNSVLTPKGIRVMVFRSRAGHALIYVFRPKAIEKILRDPQAVALLRKLGYRDIRVEPCLCQLLGRFQDYGEFPPEVGLFLGYPPEDVRGFIENGAGNHKCVGCWKVYGDEVTAQKTFARYKKCTAAYCNQWARGTSMERLAVAV